MASAGSSRRGWSTTITFKVSSLATLIVLIEPTLGGMPVTPRSSFEDRLSDRCAMKNVFRRTSCEVLKEARQENRAEHLNVWEFSYFQKKAPTREISRGKFAP